MDRGMISEDTLSFLNEPNRRYLLATRRHELTRLQAELRGPGWQRLPAHPGVAVQTIERDGVHYLLARSGDRRKKDRAIRRRERRRMTHGLRRLRDRVAQGRLKDRDKILEAVGRIKVAAPKARAFIAIEVATSGHVRWTFRPDSLAETLGVFQGIIGGTEQGHEHHQHRNRGEFRKNGGQGDTPPADSHGESPSVYEPPSRWIVFSSRLPW